MSELHPHHIDQHNNAITEAKHQIINKHLTDCLFSSSTARQNDNHIKSKIIIVPQIRTDVKININNLLYMSHENCLEYYENIKMSSEGPSITKRINLQYEIQKYAQLKKQPKLSKIYDYLTTFLITLNL